MEEKLLDFDRDIKKIAEKISWMDDDQAKIKYTVSFCTKQSQIDNKGD